MMGKKLCIGLFCVLALSGCIPDHWPEAWRVRTRPVYDKEPQPWCYRSLAEIDCYAHPLKGASPDHQIIANVPPPQPPLPTILNPELMSAITPAPAGAKPSVTEQPAPAKAVAKKKTAHKAKHKKSKAKAPTRKTAAAACQPCAAQTTPPQVIHVPTPAPVSELPKEPVSPAGASVDAPSPSPGVPVAPTDHHSQ